jgi:hypothetical protein
MVEATSRRSPKLLVLVGSVVAVALAAVVWFIIAGGDDSSGAKGGPSGTTTPTPSNTPTVPTSTPSATSLPTSPATGPTTKPPRVKPIRADFGEDVDLGNGVSVDIVDIEAVTGKAERPGEVGGPSLRFTVQVTNETGEPVNLDLAILNVYYGPDDRPANELRKPGGVSLPQSLPDGESATGKYLFNVPIDQRDQVRVEFGYTVEAPKVIYTGEARG